MANIKISELNELTTKASDDYLPIVDTSANETKKISVDKLDTKGVYLLAVDSTAPAECSTGDKYFNTTTNKIYTATGTDTWGTTGEDAELGVFYIVLDTQNIYTYNGSTLVSVGGGASGGGDTTPIGTVEAYAGTTAPNGYLLCDGSAVSRTTYADLYSVIGTTYGTGDGSTTFNLPNIKGRTVVMQDTTQTEFDTLGETGGSKYLQEHKHESGYRYGAAGGGDWTAKASESNGGGGVGYTSNAGTGNSGNLQPYIVLNYIIKANKISEVPTTATVQNVSSDSTTDTYSCDYINDCNTYSTSEVKTGKYWIDGKPIYRKVITNISSFTQTAITVSTGITTIDTLISSNGQVQRPQGINAWYSMDSCYIEKRFNKSTGQFTIASTSEYVNYSSGGYIIMEYTKTTD